MVSGSGGQASLTPGQIWQYFIALLIVFLFSLLGGFLIQLCSGIKVKKNCFCPTNGCNIKPVCKSFQIPPLVGMIIFGCIARNLTGIFSGQFHQPTFMDKYNDEWAHYIRMVCLGIILLRGGLQLSFKNKGIIVFLLTFIPQIIQASGIALISMLILYLPISLAFSMGFVIAAVSPAVLVPSCMFLQQRGYGVKKGIPTTLIAASSFDDIVAITMFGICTTVAFNKVSENSISPINAVLQNVLQVCTGLVVGMLLGILMYLFNGCKLRSWVKFAVCIFAVLSIILASELLEFHESKFIAVVIFGYLCHRIWKQDKPQHQLKILWNCLTPLLFGTIGAAIKFSTVQFKGLGKGFVIVVLGVGIRWLATFMISAKFNVKERMFVAFAWIPKATVQAAIGGFVLSQAGEELINAKSQETRDSLNDYKMYGNDILMSAVVSIILTAPLGAILANTLGQKWLEQDTEYLNQNGKEIHIKQKKEHATKKRKGFIDRDSSFINIKPTDAIDIHEDLFLEQGNHPKRGNQNDKQFFSPFPRQFEGEQKKENIQRVVNKPSSKVGLPSRSRSYSSDYFNEQKLNELEELQSPNLQLSDSPYLQGNGAPSKATKLMKFGKKEQSKFKTKNQFAMQQVLQQKHIHSQQTPNQVQFEQKLAQELKHSQQKVLHSNFHHFPHVHVHQYDINGMPNTHMTKQIDLQLNHNLSFGIDTYTNQLDVTQLMRQNRLSIKNKEDVGKKQVNQLDAKWEKLQKAAMISAVEDENEWGQKVSVNSRNSFQSEGLQDQESIGANDQQSYQHHHHHHRYHHHHHHNIQVDKIEGSHTLQNIERSQFIRQIQIMRGVKNDNSTQK